MKQFKVIFLGLLILLGIGILTGCETLVKAESFSNAYITIDINPSIEIITDEEGLVVQVNALNEDADVLLTDTDFSGKTVEETIAEILELAKEYGYLDIESENAIVVTYLTDEEEKTSRLENKLMNLIKRQARRKKLQLAVYAASKSEVDEETKELASEFNVSVGKMRLILISQELNPDLTLEEASGMSIKELTRIIIEARKELWELVKKEERDAYLLLKKVLHDNLFFKKVELLNQAIQKTTDEEFGEILMETEMSVQEVKDIYNAYYEELVDLNDSVNKEEIEDIINSDEEVQKLIQEKKELEREILELLKTTITTREKINREELKRLRNELSKVLTNLNSRIRVILNVELPELEIKYTFRVIDDNVELGFDLSNEYRKIRAKYVEIYAEKRVSMEKLEEHFITKIKPTLNDLVDNVQDQLQERKEELKQHYVDIREELKSLRDMIKDKIRDIKKRK
ncbi:MAG: hypothetical protein GX490_03485 [Bacilli bacterium]|nr:hypothetical protein [Bacilli bacterium]